MGKDGTLAALGEGVDLQWPGVRDSQNTDDTDSEFGMRLNEVLTSKGWCLMHMPSDEEVRQGVQLQAEQLHFERPKVEFSADLLGKNGSGKVCQLQPGDATAFFSSYDNNITELCGLMKPWAWHTMGFKVDSRTEGMVWTQLSNPSEESTSEPEPLNDDDVESGLLESYLYFIQRRKLCCMYFLNTDGGKISLHSKNKERPTEEVAVSSDLLLVFRCDEMTFEHAPSGDFTIYQVSVMDELPEYNFQGMVTNQQQRDALQGLSVGVGTPLGPRIMVQSVATCNGGSCNSLRGGWNMYACGTDGGFYCPTTRFDTDLYFIKEKDEAIIPGATSYSVHGSLIDDARLFDFDHEFFNIHDPKEAAAVNPKQRLLLDIGYSCLFEAGYDRNSLHGRCIGCFCGDSGTGWLQTIYGSGLQTTNASNVLDKFSMSILPSRLNFIFGMKGPCAGVDTACSAGMVAFSLAVESLRKNHPGQFSSHASRIPLEGCLGGGCGATIDPGAYVGGSAGSQLSHDGRCFTFDQSADGYARGEGCSLVFGKYIHEEEEKNNMIACVMGYCANEDGRSATITAPNGPAQQQCTNAALQDANISPGEVGASECHGSGTLLGDGIEVGALMGVHGRDEHQGSALSMPSGKPNIGHSEDNAGSAGMIKCILILKYATFSPNLHLRAMNPNLGVDGFPAFFQTENVDANVNSCVAGVSSFGFGGSNAHGEFWAPCRMGSHKTNDDIPLESYDQLTITCPITMGQIDYLTGEPALDFEVGASTKVKADILREELADYGVSRSVYEGGFRFRASEDDEKAENDDELESLPAVSVCGSWSAWTQMDPMEKQGKGIYTATVVMGNTRCEYFYMCVNCDSALRIYPVVNNASPSIEVKGPNEGGKGKYWIIDGRDLEIAEGTAFKISFSWGKLRKTVFWEHETMETVKETVSSVSTHIYSLIGSWNCYQCQDLMPSSAAPNKWESRFKITERGRAYFQIIRDHCYDQIIYPSEQNATSPTVPVRGPDGWGAGKYWLVEGEVDEIVPVQVEVNDGKIVVEIGTQLWESVQGWARHDYFLKTWNPPECVKMIMSEPGVFTSVGTLNAYSDEFEGYVDFFQILVDEDPNHCFYPVLPNARSGKQITHPPDGHNPEHYWLVSSVGPGVEYQVTFNLTVKDRRQMVTWKLL